MRTKWTISLEKTIKEKGKLRTNAEKKALNNREDRSIYNLPAQVKVYNEASVLERHDH